MPRRRNREEKSSSEHNGDGMMRGSKDFGGPMLLAQKVGCRGAGEGLVM